MSEPRKKRFPKKKPVEELPDEEVLKRIFPKKVREKLHREAREQSKDNDKSHNSKPPND